MKNFIRKLREIKNRPHPPAWARWGLRLVEAFCHPVQRLRLPLTIAAVKESRKQNDIGNWVTIALTGLNGTLRPIQRPAEIVPTLEIIRDLAPMRVMEIGTLAGGTFFLLTRVARPDATMISVELPFRGFGMGYPRWKTPLLQACGWPSQKIHLLLGDSHQTSTRASVETILGQDPLDVLLIDGDHSYAGVKQDFEMYSPLVRRGGLVIFHDIAHGGAKIPQDVARFWQEIRAQFDHVEFVELQDRGPGIGILKF